MKVEITFHKLDDTCEENRNRIEALCMTTNEAMTTTWAFGERTVLTYTTGRSATEVISDWEDECFEISEFHKFSFIGGE